MGTAYGLHAAAEADLQEDVDLGHLEAGTTSRAAWQYAAVGASWLESCGPDWRAFDAGDWQEAARQWHHTTGLPIHPAVQDLLYERHGPASLSATRELDDLAEAVQQAGHTWTGHDLIDLATVTLAAMHHSAHPGLRSAAFAYLDQLAAKPSPLSSAGFTPVEDTTIGKPSWATPATGLAQYAGIDSCGLTGSLIELESALTSSRAPADGTLGLLNARSLELATAACRVIRARCERDPKAEDRLKVLAHRRLEELERVTRVAATTRTAHHLPDSTEMMISREQMRTALIEEHYSRLEQRRHQQASAAGARTACCAYSTRVYPAAAPAPQSAEMAMEDRA
ncbi:hypothetical protein [Streptomyces sp. S1D4-20]|uniref:hypothetical protein n=1 Tax=Streptomyces sp. S1D4-20 TaxID=2594462 RepID=UPI001165879D|nr:hypothetical protein [Streptomyces sp. S1D4-20]QDN54106.1 hypothetical protein FNV67_00560 [Streptomyces sp. S1D4-20]